MGGNIIIFATFRYPGGRNILEFTGGRRPAVKKKKREKKTRKKQNLKTCIFAVQKPDWMAFSRLATRTAQAHLIKRRVALAYLALR